MIKNRNLLEWEKAYREAVLFHKNEYPFDLIVSWVRRNYSTKFPKKERKKVRCLDLGCGWGNNLRFLKKEGFNCYGVDFSKTAISSLKKEFKNKVLVGNLKELPFKNNFFDFCIDKSSIQHNPKEDIFKIFNEVHRVLKEGGKLYSVLLKRGGHKFLVGYLTKKELKKCFKKFKKVEINYLTITEKNGTKKLTSYLIEATK